MFRAQSRWNRDGHGDGVERWQEVRGIEGGEGGGLCMIYIFIVLHILALKKSLQGAKVLCATSDRQSEQGSAGSDLAKGKNSAEWNC